MNDINGIKHIQDAATLEEYRKAVIAGHVNYAEAIKTANPDLAAQFLALDVVVG